MEVLKALPFLEQYPNWIRLLVAAWLGAGGLLLGIVVYFYAGSAPINGNEPIREDGSQASARDVYSHYEAAKAGLLALDCGRFRANAHLDMFTLERRACESLAELRANMTMLAQLKEYRNDPNGSIPTIELSLGATSFYLGNDFTYVDHGPKKQALEELISQASESIKSMNTISSLEELFKWSASNPMTLDDLFIAVGFLEWLIGYDSRKHVKPSEFVTLGPFYEQPFSPNQAKKVVVKEFEQGGHPVDDYLTLLSRYD